MFIWNAAPSHEFLLPEDVWIELVPSSQADLWRVLEAEQNPRLRLRVDINRQLSDIIKLVELKWQLAAERMLALLDFPVVRESPTVRLLIRTAPHQAIDGAIRLQEVARVRSGDLSLRSFVKRRLASKTNDLSSGMFAFQLSTMVANFLSVLLRVLCRV
ncbi:unnamed protein product [Dicrocoelium dendriticum]|nr:unnamed protein product [Dicrocoelium dendriticum]